jgi:hypothetical protein
MIILAMRLLHDLNACLLRLRLCVIHRYAWSGVIYRERSEGLIFWGAVNACSITGQYQGRAHYRVQSFDLPFPHPPPLSPTLRQCPPSGPTRNLHTLLAHYKFKPWRPHLLAGRFC